MDCLIIDWRKNISVEKVLKNHNITYKTIESEYSLNHYNKGLYYSGTQIQVYLYCDKKNKSIVLESDCINLGVCLIDNIDYLLLTIGNLKYENIIFSNANILPSINYYTELFYLSNFIKNCGVLIIPSNFNNIELTFLEDINDTYSMVYSPLDIDYSDLIYIKRNIIGAYLNCVIDSNNILSVLECIISNIKSLDFNTFYVCTSESINLNK
jgi:hypothetical protein